MDMIVDLWILEQEKGYVSTRFRQSLETAIRGENRHVAPCEKAGTMRLYRDVRALEILVRQGFLMWTSVNCEMPFFG